MYRKLQEEFKHAHAKSWVTYFRLSKRRTTVHLQSIYSANNWGWCLITFMQYCVVPENIHTSLMEGIFFQDPLPLWKLQFSLIHFFKCFSLRELPPPGKLQTVLLGMDIFWNCTLYRARESLFNNLGKTAAHPRGKQIKANAFLCELLQKFVNFIRSDNKSHAPNIYDVFQRLKFCFQYILFSKISMNNKCRDQ